VPFDLADAFLAAAETALGARLPESYRNSMLRSNGGELHAAGDDWQQHPIADTSDRRRLSRTANHILSETQALREWPGFPANALSIASNGSGDSLLLLRRGAAFEPTVYAWSHETHSLSKVANDFAELTGS
jgi:hypothetical protein